VGVAALALPCCYADDFFGAAFGHGCDEDALVTLAEVFAEPGGEEDAHVVGVLVAVYMDCLAEEGFFEEGVSAGESYGGFILGGGGADGHVESELK